MATLTIVPRKDWGARHGRGGTNITPARGGCALHYNGGPIGRGDHAQCAARVRSIENFHVNGNGWAGIAYNWLICEHGVVFEGRGWGRRSAGQGTNAGNQNFLAIMFLMGGTQTMTPQMRTAGRLLILHLRSRGAGNQNRPHSFFTSTSCPGNSVRSWISSGIPAGSGALPTPTTPAPDGRPVLREGSTGMAVRELQELLGITIDGIFGPLTRQAVTDYQSRHGLDIDGVVGPQTWAHLLEGDTTMPKDLSYRSYRRQDLPPGEWVTLRFEERRQNEAAWAEKTFEPSVLVAGANDRYKFDSDLSLRVQGLAHGQEVQARWVVYNWDAATSTATMSYRLPIDSPVHDGGALHCKTSQRDRLTRNRRLRLEVCQYGDPEQEVYVDFARVDTHYWDY